MFYVSGIFKQIYLTHSNVSLLTGKLFLNSDVESC